MKHFIKKRNVSFYRSKTQMRRSLLKNQNIGRQINAMSFLEFFKNAESWRRTNLEAQGLSQSDRARRLAYQSSSSKHQF